MARVGKRENTGPCAALCGRHLIVAAMGLRGTWASSCFTPYTPEMHKDQWQLKNPPSEDGGS